MNGIPAASHTGKLLLGLNLRHSMKRLGWVKVQQELHTQAGLSTEKAQSPLEHPQPWLCCGRILPKPQTHSLSLEDQQDKQN